MKTMKHYFPILLLLAGMGLASTAEAALISRLGGLAVYDTDRNITWLANANVNGTMNWTAANAWAAGLNVGGYTGWRLPTADPTCINYNCTNSELGHLYYTEGGLTQGQNITSSAVLPSFFSNMQNAVYWGTEFAPNPGFAWIFSSYGGSQYYYSKGTGYYAWAVRSGDVGGGGSVPEPGIIALMGIGALAWAGTRQKRRV